MANQSKIQKENRNLKRDQEVLTLVVILLTIVTGIGFWLVTK